MTLVFLALYHISKLFLSGFRCGVDMRRPLRDASVLQRPGPRSLHAKYAVRAHSDEGGRAVCTSCHPRDTDAARRS